MIKFYRNIIFCLILITKVFVNGQFYHFSLPLDIQGDTYIFGDLKSDSAISMKNDVSIFLNGDLFHDVTTNLTNRTFIAYNRSNGVPPNGKIIFNNSTIIQKLNISNNTVLNNLQNSNPFGLNITNSNSNFGNLEVWDSFDLSGSSNITLDSVNLELKFKYNLDPLLPARTNTYGSISGESNSSLIIPSSDSLEKVFVIGPYASSSTTEFPNDYNIGLSINHSDNYNDSVEYSRYGTYIPNVSDTSFNRYFVVTEPVELNSPEIEYHNNLLRSMNEDSLDIYISDNYGQTWSQVGATTDTVSNIITDNNNFGWKPSLNAPLNQSIITVGKKDCNNPPEVNLSLDSTAVCSGNNAVIEFDSITPSCSVEWFKDGVFSTTLTPNNGSSTPVPTLSVNQSGWYLITIEDSRGCLNKDSIKVKSSDLPEFGTGNCFGINLPCIGDPMNFSANPDSSDSSNMTYNWDFDYYSNNGSNISSLKNPSFLYTQSGVHSVQLTITDSSGCFSSCERTVTVLPYPSADFSFQNSCDQTPINFTNLSTTTYGGLNYNWNFGVATSNLEDPSNTFPSSGSFEVELIADIAGTCRDTIVKTINVFPLPNANFTFNDTCENDTVFYSNQSTILISDSITSSKWNFSNVSVSNFYNSYYVYSQNGTYSTELKVTSSNGCSDSTSKSVEIFPSPSIDFLSRNNLNSPTNSFCLYDTILFYPNSDSLVSFWDFGDDSTSNDTNALKNFNNFGTYNVELTQTSSNGCSSKKTKNIEINPIPVALTNSPNDQCLGLPVSFASLSFVDNNNTISSHSWNFEYPLPSTPTLASNPSPLIFSDTGTKLIELTVTSNNNCISRILDTIQIFPIPNVDFGQDSISTCGTSYVLNAPQNCNNFWSNGLTTDSIIVNYSNTYNVKSTDLNGCINRDTISITLNSSFSPQISSSSACDSSVLDCGSVDADYYWFNSNSSYTYSYSNGQVNLTGLIDTIGTSRFLKIDSSGLYKVLVVDQNNCPGEDSINAIINLSPVNFSTFSDTLSPCVGDSMLTDSLPFGVNYSYSWNPQLSSNYPLNSSRIWVSQLTTYTVLIEDTITTCNLTNVISVIPRSNPQLDLSFINNFGNDSINICDSVTVNSDALSNSYLWTDASQNLIGFNSSININSSGYYSCEISFGTCSSSDSLYVAAYETPTFQLLGGITDTLLCSYNTLVMDDLSNYGATFNWSNGSTDSILFINSAGNYIVEVGDSLSPGLCKSKDTILVNFSPVLDVDLGTDLVKCIGSDLELSTGINNNDIQHEWYKDGLLINNSNSSSLFVSDTGLYNVIISDTLNCNAKDTIKVNSTNQELNAQFLSTSIVSQGDSVKFINLSYPSPFTSSWLINDSIYDIDSPIHSVWLNSFNDSVTNDTVTAQLTVRNTSCIASLEKKIVIRPSKKNSPILNEEFAVYTEIDCKLYPNPNNGNFILDFQTNNEFLFEAYIGIYNLTGELLLQEKIFIFNDFQKQIQIDNIPNGVYLVTIYSSFSIKTIKFIKI